MTETTEMIKAIANDSKVRIDRIVANYEELEEENAELKENYRKRGDTIISLERQLRLNIHSDNLTKAKEIIKELYEGLDKLYLSGLSDKQIAFIERLQDKAEQFLNSEVEK